MTLNPLAFVAVALVEIAGCFAFWMWLRQGRSHSDADHQSEAERHTDVPQCVRLRLNDNCAAPTEH